MEFDRHTFYIVCAYGMVILAVIVELWSARRRHRLARLQASTIASLTTPTSSGNTGPSPIQSMESR